MGNTSFQEVYDCFLSKITDDMYQELTYEETQEMLLELLREALISIEFPKWKKPFDLDVENQCFYDHLTNNEVNLVAYYMIYAWLGFQLANVELVRQKYSGSDFSFTSQAAHMKQLQALRDSYKQQAFHLQRLINRREYDLDGRVRSSLHRIMEPLDVGEREDVR